MVRRYRYLFSFISLFFIDADLAFSQAPGVDSIHLFKMLPAGSEYKASGLYKWFWGSNYRNLWTMPVMVRTINLDSAYGGIKAYAAENAGEAKMVYLNDAQGRAYVLSSVNSKPGNLLPPMFRNTMFESRVNDGVSITNPYAGLTIPVLASAAQAHVPQPLYVFVPKQAALKEFSEGYGDDLYKLMPADSGHYLETGRLLQLLNTNTDIAVDKKAYIRERLLDMFVNDWNRGEDKWRWAERSDGKRRQFTPVTANRNAAYTKFDGRFTKLGFNLTKANLIQSFDDSVKNINSFNFRANDLDRRLLNEASLSDWQTEAAALQLALTDSVIEAAINALPKEIYAATGKLLIEGLKARRSYLAEWATRYYTFLAEETEVPGTNKGDVFEVQALPDSTVVHVFGTNGQGKKEEAPYYSRTFYTSETKQIRLFGLQGKNWYTVSGNTKNGIPLKIINSDSDSVDITASHRWSDIIVYGNKDSIKTTQGTTVKVINDTADRLYNYHWYKYDKKGIMPVVFYSNEDRLFVGVEYNRKHYSWGKSPFAFSHALNVHYSLLEKGFSTSYKALFPKLIAKADLSLYANYDDVRWLFFFGVGNNTPYDNSKKIEYYTARNRQWTFQPSLVRSFGKSTVSVFGSIHGVKFIDDTSRFLDKGYNPDEVVYTWQTFAGGGISYKYNHLNDPLVPTKGFHVDATAAGFQDIKISSGHYFSYSGNMNVYIPLVSKFSLNIRTGGQTVTGNPQFFQLASLGGTRFRGAVRYRYTGKSSFYNTNDIRFISPVHTSFFAGKAGLLAFVDNGRVWAPGESSNEWHFAYGGGIILAPFNLLYADFNFGFHKKENSLQVRVTFSIP